MQLSQNGRNRRMATHKSASEIQLHLLQRRGLVLSHYRGTEKMIVAYHSLHINIHIHRHILGYFVF